MKRFATAALLATALAVSSGCNDTGASAGADAAVGVYTLQTIDGLALPVVVDQVGNDTQEVIQGSVTLDADRSFDDATTLRFTIAGVVTTEVEVAAGSWTLTGRTVGFTPGDGSGVYEMTWDGADQLTQLFSGFTLVYRRTP